MDKLDFDILADKFLLIVITAINSEAGYVIFVNNQVRSFCKEKQIIFSKPYVGLCIFLQVTSSANMVNMAMGEKYMSYIVRVES